MPTNNIVIAQEALDSFMESHGHKRQAAGSQQERVLAGILAVLIEIADDLATMAGRGPVNTAD